MLASVITLFDIDMMPLLYLSKRVQLKGNRNSIDIASHVQEAANGSASKTNIMYRALPSYKQMKQYLNFLSENGLLAYDNQLKQAPLFKTSEKGHRLLQTIIGWITC
jgi:predicted transcriptional regulator